METLISPIPLLTVCLFIIPILGITYLCWRAQSLHFLLRRFWLLVHGSKNITNPRLQWSVGIVKSKTPPAYKPLVLLHQKFKSSVNCLKSKNGVNTLQKSKKTSATLF